MPNDTSQIRATPPLTASGLTVLRRGKAILSEAALILAPSEFTVVIGPNGAGKSTLLKCLCGELNPDRGSVEIAGRLVSDWPSVDLARRRVVLAQQTPLAFPFQVHEVVALGRLPHRAQSDAELDARAVTRALERVDLTDFANRRYTTLSGGEQQRAQLGRILAQLDHRPRIDAVADARGDGQIVFLDEPISALDIRHQCRILGIARKLADEGNCVFAVLHDLNFALRFADRLILMREGRIWHDVAVADCRPEMLEDIFEISLARIPDAARSGNDFFFPKAPASHQV